MVPDLDASELYDEANASHLVPKEWPGFILGRMKTTPYSPRPRSVRFSPELTSVRTFSAMHAINAPPDVVGVIPPSSLPSPVPARLNVFD